MKSWLSLLVVASFVLCVSAEAQARFRFFGCRGCCASSSSVSSAVMSVDIDPELQKIAQARADSMAKLNSMDHNIHGYSQAPRWHGRTSKGFAVQEGIGCSSNLDPQQVATCVCGSVVVADAHAFGHGQCFRVRLFR